MDKINLDDYNILETHEVIENEEKIKILVVQKKYKYDEKAKKSIYKYIEKNKEKLNKNLKDRYHNDEEYRKKIKEKRKIAYQNKNEGKE